MFDLRQREFITLLGGAATVWPLAARGQQPAMPVIGYLSARSPEDTAHLLEAFRRGLSEAGLFEGHSVTIEYGWAFGQADRLPELAANLVRKPVNVLVSTGGESAALTLPGKVAPEPKELGQVLTDLHKKPGQLRDMLGADAIQPQQQASASSPITDILSSPMAKAVLAGIAAMVVKRVVGR